jgi:hypothetical protein
MWDRVDTLIDAAPTVEDLRIHRLELLAARRMRETGREPPAEFVGEERVAAIAQMTAPPMLEHIATASEGPIIVLKGPEVAARYADTSLRGFVDLDLLVPDAPAVQRALVDSGFEAFGDPDEYLELHHLRPLRLAGMLVSVEVHSAPKWVPGLRPPRIEELLEASVPSATGVAGIAALSPAHHALILAAHSWAHQPLRRLRDLIDIAAVSAFAEREEIRRIASAWELDHVWRTTQKVIDALFGDGPTPLVLRAWARNVAKVRERTVLELHAEHALSNFWALPPGRALARLPRALGADLTPWEGESWGSKLARTTLAVRNASHRHSSHSEEWKRRADRPEDN